MARFQTYRMSGVWLWMRKRRRSFKSCRRMLKNSSTTSRYLTLFIKLDIIYLEQYFERYFIMIDYCSTLFSVILLQLLFSSLFFFFRKSRRLRVWRRRRSRCRLDGWVRDLHLGGSDPSSSHISSRRGPPRSRVLDHHKRRWGCWTGKQ